MNVSLPDKLKELRKTKNVSQEKFAEYLGVSYQAVSKWENGVTSPDILLLPDIARYYGITVDELLQVEQIDADRYFEECCSRARKLYRNGKRSELIPLWLEAYKKFPNDIQVKEMLMSTYFDTDKVKYQNEIIEIGTDIYNTSSANGGNSYFQGQAIQQIARTYYENGNSEKANEWMKKAHQISHCQELLFMQIIDDKEDLKKTFSFANHWFFNTLFYMTQRLGVIDNTENLGRDYAKNIYLTVIKMFELAFPNDDMSFEFLRCLAGMYHISAEYEIFSSNDEALIKKYLTRAVECVVKSVNIKAHELMHPLFFEWPIEDAPSDNMQLVRALKKVLEYHAYDEYKAKDWFKELLERLARVM
jgi:transcriptional regulator with XRE-family HTH domain